MFTHSYERTFVRLFYQVLSTSAHKATHSLDSNADPFSMKMIKYFLSVNHLLMLESLKMDS